MIWRLLTVLLLLSASEANAVNATDTRTVTCKDNRGNIVDDSFCLASVGAKPPVTRVGAECIVEPQVFLLKVCRYTSSGNGRYACGDGGFGSVIGGVRAPNPDEICSGNIVRGGYLKNGITPTGGPSGYFADQISTRVPGWASAPPLIPNTGALCVVHYASGYSNGSDQYWGSVYFDGLPKSPTPQLNFIGK